MESEKYPYQKEWREYREGNTLGCLAVPIVIILILLFKYFSPQLPDYFDKILLIVFASIAYFSLISGKDWAFKCPRCRENFDYSKKIKPTTHCINCDLPIYYGSSYFWDYWGTERGNAQIEKVKWHGNIKE